MDRKIFNQGKIIAVVAAVVAVGYIQFGAHNANTAHAAVENTTLATAAASPAAPLLPSSLLNSSPTDFSSIVERFGPAVVNISVTGKAQKIPALLGFPGMDSNDPFSQFFHRFGPQFSGVPQEGQLICGQGSGFVVSKDGLIMTNAHVIEGAAEVTVKLTDRREFKAKVLGSDRQTDVAVIKIDAKDLPTVIFGNPASLHVGEPVLAIGSPFGFENSATSGIVSAKSRSLPNDAYVPFIQTDVAVNPGNSGGPLFNLRGEVVGINSQIYSRTGGFQGLSFAIPIDTAARIEEQLVHSGKVIRGRLGVSIQEINQALAESFGLKKPNGALVNSVERDGPAARAGVQAGDVIVQFDGQEINHSTDLPARVSTLKPGTTAKLELVRDGVRKSLMVTVGERKEANVAQNEEATEPAGTGAARLGVAVRPLEKEEQRSIGVTGGLLVESAQGAAAEAGVMQGDVIVSVNGAPVSSVDQLRKQVRKAGKNLALLVQRDANRLFIPVDLG